eukprot:m.279956 g.279956  ORF g.279956 m.279956 type:complete len:770 (+) comp16323_c13_seq1:95-2404(+)
MMITALTAIAAMSAATLGGPPPPSPCTGPCATLLVKYGTMLNETCAKVTAKAPTLNAADEAAFMKLYQNFTGGNSTVEAPVVAAAEKLLDASDVQAFLSAPDSFVPGGLDADMVLCATLTESTPLGLAEFASMGSEEMDAVSALLNNTILMRDMLVAGGAVASETDKGGNVVGKKFGQAMAIYLKLQQASPMLRAALEATRGDPTYWDDRSQGNILKRLALGTALGHAVPIHQHYPDPDCDSAYDWCPQKATPLNESEVDPVARYLHYENAYHNGELDPATEVLTGFECKHTTNSPASNSDLSWIRASMFIYRPDHVATTDYSWRYARAVRTEVAYGDPQCASMPGACDGHYAEIPAADGVCGPRAFFGRYTRLAFGMPTWGATQPGHAAMTTWAPDGWHVLLGASWPFCWWGDRGGPDFYLEAQARENRGDFQQVLRGTWLSQALGEEPVGQSWGRSNDPKSWGQGGPWAALMLYAKKISVAKNPPTTREIGPSVVPTKVAALAAKWSQPQPAEKITTTPEGNIRIPASVYSMKNRSAAVSVNPSADAGQQLMHGGCASSVGPPCTDVPTSMFGYSVPITTAGTYYLTANITTWHPNQDMNVTVNDGSSQAVPMQYTVGWWNETQPIAVTLTAGNNTIAFTRTTVRPVVYKNFMLYKVKPNIPKPPANYTPVPSPPSPPPGAYIEIPADTTCEKQGILPVPADDCSRACVALGFKASGPRSRPNISGCFVMTQGQYENDCNYNTNASATCTPPCTLYGAVVRSLCIRN